MRKLLKRMTAALCTAALLCTVCPALPHAHAAEAADIPVVESGLSTVPKLTREEITSLLANRPAPDALYAEEPHVSGAPYTAGKLTQQALEAGLYELNMFRQLAGVEPVVLNEEYTRTAQNGAALCGAMGEMNHRPDIARKPKDMPDEFFHAGYDGTSKSNLFMSGSESLPHSLRYAVRSWMGDEDAGNVDRLGHRRWQLNPGMGAVGFGWSNGGSLGYSFAAEYAFDRSNTSLKDYAYIAWPSSGYFPNELIPQYGNGGIPWSITLNPTRYQIPARQDLTITVESEELGKSWVLDGKKDYPATNYQQYLHVDTQGYGVNNCIIFRFTDTQQEAQQIMHGKYTVTVQGLKDKAGNPADLRYTVDFFHPDDLKPHVTVHFDFEGAGDFVNKRPDVSVPVGGYFSFPLERELILPEGRDELQGWYVNGVRSTSFGEYINEDTVLRPNWHTHEWVLTPDDGYFHVLKCACGDIKGGYQSHEYHYVHNDAEHWEVCDCGYELPNSHRQHTLNYRTEPATCTLPERRIGSCWRCGYETVVEELAPAKGHSWGEWVPDEQAGIETRTCPVCGETETRPLTPPQEAVWKGVGLTLADRIGVNFVVSLPASVDLEQDYMEFVIPASTQPIHVAVKDAKKLSDGLYQFTCPMAAKEMTDTITARMVMGGKPGKQISYRVESYAKTILADDGSNFSTNVKEVVRTMLNYGAKSQLHFAYHTERLADRSLTEAQKQIQATPATFDDYTAAKTGKASGIRYYGSSLNLESTVSIHHYFDLEPGQSLDNFSFVLVEKDGTELPVKAVESDGTYMVKIQQIYAANLCEPYLLRVTNRADGSSMELSYSAYSYANIIFREPGRETLKPLTLAMADYCEASRRHILHPDE